MYKYVVANLFENSYWSWEVASIESSNWLFSIFILSNFSIIPTELSNDMKYFWSLNFEFLTFVRTRILIGLRFWIGDFLKIRNA